MNKIDDELRIKRTKSGFVVTGTIYHPPASGDGDMRVTPFGDIWVAVSTEELINTVREWVEGHAYRCAQIDLRKSCGAS